ncbi:MAG: YqgE/AlgH family protein [Alphaproteobacteria bacterium]|nr:YqgE/AlgH family protein [Alphaproteobacteria bacterium]
MSRIKKIGGWGAKLPVEPRWLTGQFLVAMPGMADPRFSRTVIYVCSHGPSGAMGLVINRLFGEADFRMLLEQLNVESVFPTPDIPVQFGGPVEMGRGFVLHSSEYLREGTTRIDDFVAITATVEIIQDIADGKGPDRILMALGYAGWGAGQLEEELKGNGWLTVAADENILFDFDLDSKWDRAMAKIGISPAMLSDTAGHA